MSASIAERFDEASALLASVRDVISERTSADAPSWCVDRGWQSFLEGLSDESVLVAERDGLAASLGEQRTAPSDLIALASAVRRVIHLEPASGSATEQSPLRRASPRKQAQVAAFAALLAGRTRNATRIVDVGSGHGHLTRHLASALRLVSEGWERDPERVAVARSLTDANGPSFLELDARDAASAFRTSDLVVGLHACGELGDHAVRAAASAGSSLALIGCCLQKRDGARSPLVTPPNVSTEDLVLGHAVLGLGNARDGDDGIEADLATRSLSRKNRLALRILFRDAGIDLSPGEEMRGINRRRATGSFASLAEHAFARSSLSPPSSTAIGAASSEASRCYALMRRWELPRTMFARLIEIWVALDRAMLLFGAGRRVDVSMAFDAQVSPRNVAVIATQ